MMVFLARSRRVCWLAFYFTVALHWLTNDCAVHADLWGITTDTTSSFNRLVRFDPVTGDELSGGLPTGTPGLARPSGITTGPDGIIYVSSRGFDDEGTENDVAPGILSVTCSSTGACGTPTTFADFTAGADPTEPAVLKFGPDGNLYAAELFFVGGDDVRVYSPAGTRLANAASGMFPTSIAFDSADNLLVATPSNPGFMVPATIQRFSAGTPIAPLYIDDPMNPELGAVSSMLELQNGDTLAVDLFGGRIVRISPAGVLSHFATIPESLPSAPTFPSDIVFDPDGNLIVSVLGPTNAGEPGGVQGQLLRYDLQGNLIGGEPMLAGFEPIAGLTWTNSPLTIVGNYDGLGGVDGDDYARWRRDFGKFVAPGNGADGNGDGVVDIADFVVWSKYASGGSGSIALGEVPEPTALASVLSAMFAANALGRRRRSPRHSRL